MDKKIILQRIADIDNDISKVQMMLKSMESNITFPDIYEDLSSEAALKIEYITCKFRRLICSSTTITKPALMNKVSEAHGIEITYAGEVFSVTIPSLLPKKRKVMNSEFILDPLYYALDKYCSVNKVDRFLKCVVCFEHIYSEDTPARRFRDYDNVEAKQVLDAISTYTMVDDGGAFCDVYQTSKYGKKDCTKVSTIPKNMFQKWLSECEKVSEIGTEFSRESAKNNSVC